MDGLRAYDRFLSMFLRNDPRLGARITGTCTACGCRGRIQDVCVDGYVIMVCHDCYKPGSQRLYPCIMDKQFIDEYPSTLAVNQAKAKQYVLKELLCKSVRFDNNGLSVCMCCFHYRKHALCGAGYAVCADCCDYLVRTFNDLIIKGMMMGVGGLITDKLTGNNDADGVIHIHLCNVYVGVKV